MTGARVLFHVQHLLGIGHLKRAEAIAGAIAERGLAVTVALGGRPTPDVAFAGASVVQLPPAELGEGGFVDLRDADGRPIDDAWRERRRGALLGLLDAVQPDIVLVEMFPFGRRKFAFELLPLLEAARALSIRPLLATSVRDILVTHKASRAVEAAARVASHLDLVLVHGDPEIIPFGATFVAAEHIADKLRYTGYVAPPRPDGARPSDADARARGEVIVSAGGGAVGGVLLAAAIAARSMSAAGDAPWRVIAGPNLPEHEFRRLRGSAPAGVAVERFRADFSARLYRARLSISQAGYNTTMDLLAAEVPAIVVPFEAPGETEQRLRADLLQARGRLHVLPEADLSPEALAQAIDAVLARPPAMLPPIDLSGAARTAEILSRLRA